MVQMENQVILQLKRNFKFSFGESDYFNSRRVPKSVQKEIKERKRNKSLDGFSIGEFGLGTWCVRDRQVIRDSL